MRLIGHPGPQSLSDKRRLSERSLSGPDEVSHHYVQS